MCPTNSGLAVNDSKGSNKNNNTNGKSQKGLSPTEGEVLFLTLVKSTENGQTVTKVKISCDNIELAADIIQDLGKYFSWDELDSEADFPIEFERFDEVRKTISPSFFT